jgi:hypothetical protein
MDAPTTDLDPIGKLGVFEIASELKERDDVTLIVVEHETEETLEADRIVILRDGRVVTDRPAREVLRDVNLLEESRIMPLGVTRYFHEMGFWQGQLPLTPAEGLREFRQRGWRVDPVRGLEAYADGFDVLPALRACEEGEIFITATGSTDVLTNEHFERMREGAILANAGGVDVEIDVDGLRDVATGSREVRRNVEEFALADGRRVYLIGGGWSST